MRGVFKKDLKIALKLKGLEPKTILLHTHNIKPFQIRPILLRHPLFPPLKTFQWFMFKLLLTLFHLDHTILLSKKVQKSFVIGY